ncbi:uncharacterized membrane protein At3g27390-like [Selaginella moellendorffii]|uniref:uncharacterized membrane protein At3g27390-like n=1 Tax=Selaginella moellendorffii TaxID=88036 RepID=UPI000D1CCF6B|nr:uncharacterized membrane protein At3g27390-like [Selaginella moellendorffii]|eukprot:XP_024515202.1 uncharacterized membrane protein At3g27390-like [Selaginella moellendorffii]
MEETMEETRSSTPGKSKKRVVIKIKAKRAASNTARLVGCAGVAVVGLVVDVPAVCGIAVAKAPVFLWKGWKQEVINMEECVEDGVCSRPICLPVTGAMLALWPARVAASLGSALLYSLAKGFNGAVVAYREKSIRCGLKHVIAAIAEYDELSNDMIHLRQGTCLPKPAYRKNHRHRHRRDQEPADDLVHEREQQKRGLGVSFHVIREMDLGELFEFMSSGYGPRLIEQGLLASTDKLTVESAALTILSYLLTSTKQEERGHDHYYDSLETLQRQILEAELDATEEQYLYDMVLRRQGGFRELDPIRGAMLQAFGRRIRGISAFLSRNPEFRKQYEAAMDSTAASTALDHPDRSVVMEDMISFD